MSITCVMPWKSSGATSYMPRSPSGFSEVRRASPVDFPFSPVLIPIPVCCSVHGFLHSITMGRRKKKKIPLIPFSQWTPFVQGLNTDASDSGSEAVDPDSAPPMEPIDEEIELNSEDESCPSSNGDSAMPETSIDDTLADGKDSAPLQNSPLEINLMNPNASTSSMDDMGSAPEAAIEEIRANPDVPHLDDLRCPIPGNSLDSGLNPSQNLEKLADLGSTECEGKRAQQARMDSSISSPSHASPAQVGLHTLKDDNFKGQWSHLFANNRKPLDDFMLKKVDIKPVNGLLDFSDPSLADEFLFEPPFCMIGYFFGSFPGVVALRRLCDSWFPGITFCLHSSGWIIFRFPEENQLLHVLQQGPCVLHGQILILRKMPRFFYFSREGRSLMPIWVIFPNIPLQLMRKEFLEVLGSQIGTPIMTDKLTHTLERVSYARILVEVDLVNDMITKLPIKLPGDHIHTQQIRYEKRPFFCKHCWSIGH
ncbi:hypothetical protein Dimus_027306 [Dionaea muscipula]